MIRKHALVPVLSLAAALTFACKGDDAGDTSASESAGTDAGSTGSASSTSSGASESAGSSGSTGGGGSSGGGESESATSGGSTTGEPLEPFSFFVTSLESIQLLSGSEQGFGGDLRYGEEGMGAGLRGADKICAEIAEMSMPGAGAKEWRAFLSATADEDGQVVHAKDRIGEGPWYDRLGRLVAMNKTDLLTERPTGMDPTIIDDFPNEWGVPNHQPDPNMPEVDNHDTLTGTNENGELYAATATCLDWTSNKGDLASEGRPRVGHSWPRYGMGGMMPPQMGDGSMANWMSSLDEAGCAPGINLIEMGPPIPGEVTVGSGGGYGGIYCFALTP
ncbi:MAG: hypothetical protein H6710_07645 [Myxococcales bacterium]|nr:hypothetical protein [Myxococcales bacterium]